MVKRKKQLFFWVVLFFVSTSYCMNRPSLSWAGDNSQEEIPENLVESAIRQGACHAIGQKEYDRRMKKSLYQRKQDLDEEIELTQYLKQKNLEKHLESVAYWNTRQQIEKKETEETLKTLKENKKNLQKVVRFKMDIQRGSFGMRFQHGIEDAATGATGVFGKSFMAASGQLAAVDVYHGIKECLRDKSEEHFNTATKKLSDLYEMIKFGEKSDEYIAARTYYLQELKKVKNPHMVIISSKEGDINLKTHISVAEGINDELLRRRLVDLYVAPSQNRRPKSFDTIYKEWEKEQAKIQSPKAENDNNQNNAAENQG